jgi:hypothetical protein
MKLPKLSVQLSAGTLCLFLSVVMLAQVKTETSTQQGHPTVVTTVERGEVVYVSGNDLVVKMDDGQIRNFSNVPDAAKVTVDGKELTVHDLKPGMKLERTITSTSTPQTVTKVETVSGKVWHVNPPNTVVLTLADGSNQTFKIPSGQKFTVDGKETDAFGLRKGQQVSATRLTTTKENVSAEHRKVTGEMPPPPQVSAEAMSGPILIVVAPAPAAPTTPEVAEAKPAEAPPMPKEIPQTASTLPVLGLIGSLVLLAGIAVLVFSPRTQ